MIKTNVNLENIKRLRKESKLSQREIANIIGAKTVYPYHRKELGYQEFTADEIFFLAIFYKKPLEYFFKTNIA